MPDVFRCLRCEYWCAYLLPLARTRLRVHWAPGIPRALCFQRARDFLANLGRNARRERGCVFAKGEQSGLRARMRALAARPPSEARGGHGARCALAHLQLQDLPSLRGALATKQSSLAMRGAMDCFAD